MDNENLTMAELPFTVGMLWYDAQNERSNDSQPYFFDYDFETNRFFALAGIEQPLVTYVLHRYGLRIWIR
jgi:hypothetical protein